MPIQKSIRQLLVELWSHINSRRRLQFSFLLILMLTSSIAEVLSIGAVVPFLGALTKPEYIYHLPSIQPLLSFLKISRPEELLLPLTIVFCLSAIMAGSMRLLMLWFSNRLCFSVGAELSMSIYRRTLYQPYIVHCSRNSSEVISGISNKTEVVIYVISMTLTLVSSAVILTMILIALLAINPLIAGLAFGGFGFIYLVIVGLTRKRLLLNSERISYESTNVIKSLQEGMGAIRDVLIDGSQAIYCDIYGHADSILRRAQASNSFIASSPRYIMESLGILLISFLAYLLAQDSNGVASAIPFLGALALGAQRLLPVLQQAYAAWSGIQSGQAPLQNVLVLLDQPLPEYVYTSNKQTLSFEESFQLKSVSFRYLDQGPYIFKDLDLVIPKGDRVGFIGPTGCGKSTLIDIVMGLLWPTSGVLEVDGRVINPSDQQAWQKHIAHVPQAIYLADASIQENIAFGIPKEKIDPLRVRRVAQQAQIAETIESWPMQYQTQVGERGMRLSGGQRQRIGIARALYKEADIIIFDEATSALDSETESSIMDAIESLSSSLTILIIAHRLTTLKKCNQIVKLGVNGIEKIGPYSQIINVKN